MSNWVYRLAYWLGMTRWDSGQVPPEVIQAFQSSGIPAGAALDLGCGTGTNTIYMAQQGREAYGVDFVPQAISKARRKAKAAGVEDHVRWFVADVAHLEKLGLPRIAFALDLGCFHGLGAEDRQAYARQLAELMVPGGKYMLYVHEAKDGRAFYYGVDPQTVREVFSPWFSIDRDEEGRFGELRSTWFWMTRKGE